jgi:hypothetical protein
MKIFIWLLALLLPSVTFAQPVNQDAVLIRHDTVMIKADKTIIETILKAIDEGKIVAIDQVTGQPIPAGKVYTWRMATDTILRYDSNGSNAKPEVVQQLRKAASITNIRVMHDWYFNVTENRFTSYTRWIELLEEIHTSTGDFIGMRPLCRVYY